MGFGVGTELEWNGDEVIRQGILSRFRALTTSAILVNGRAIVLTPVDTGNLRSSITYVVEDTGSFPDDKGKSKSIKAGKGTAIIGTVVFYGPYVEFGTRFMRAQAFLGPALASSINDIKDIFTKQYKDIRWIT